ncbi:MAG: LTA synthase family protein [Alistipes sp.]|nr:LTA synthase family protein [Candidatus Alistipes equi]
MNCTCRNIAISLWRIVWVYVILCLTRIAFVLYNHEAFLPLSSNEIPRLILGALRFDSISVAYALSVWAVFSFLPTPLIGKKWYQDVLFWLYAISVFFLVICLNLSDAVYFKYTGKRITAEELFFAKNSNSIFLIVKFLLENWYMVLYGLLLTWLIRLGYIPKKKYKVTNSKKIFYGCGSLTLVLATLLALVAIRGGLSRMARPTALPYAAKFVTNSQKAAIVLSNPFCLIRTIGSEEHIDVPTYLSQNEAESIFTPYHYPSKRVMEKQNVVIFIMESMSAEHSKFLRPELYSNEEKGFTPFLDSLMESAMTFRHMYANGKRSIQAMPTILASIPSMKEPFMLMQESIGKNEAIGTLLKKEGYSTSFFCGSENGSMGFDAYAVSAGYDHYFSMDDYLQKKSKDDFDGYWGIWDDRFMDYMGEYLDTVREPFLSTMFTISSHHPFVVPKYAQDKVQKGYTKIHPCVSYVDWAFSEFFRKYGQSKWFQNTLFVFVADHVSSEKYAEDTNYNPEDFHIISFIYSPKGTIKEQIGVACSQIDIMPTLLGVLSYPHPYFAFGKDRSKPDSTKDGLCIVYDNAFKAFSNDYIFYFSDGKVEHVYSVTDYSAKNDLIDSVDYATVQKKIQAFLQQYYQHLKDMDYMVCTN